MAAASEAQALSALGTTVDFAGERLDIRPLRFGALLEIIAIAAPLVDAVAAAASGLVGEADELAFFLRLVSAHHREVPEVLGLACDRDAAFIASGELDDVVRLFMAVYQVNASFFDQRLGPALNEARAKWRTKGSGDGPTPPSS